MKFKKMLSSTYLDICVGDTCVVFNAEQRDMRGHNPIEREINDSNIWIITNVDILRKPTTKYEYIRDAVEVELENTRVKEEQLIREFSELEGVDVIWALSYLNALKAYRKRINRNIDACKCNV